MVLKRSRKHNNNSRKGIDPSASSTACFVCLETRKLEFLDSGHNYIFKQMSHTHIPTFSVENLQGRIRREAPLLRSTGKIFKNLNNKKIIQKIIQIKNHTFCGTFPVCGVCEVCEACDDPSSIRELLLGRR